MASIFSRIAQGEIPSYKVAADDRHYAFLDINPLAEGHTLVIPRREVDYLFDLEPDEVRELFAFAQRVAAALKQAVPCRRVGMAVLGFDVPHAHIHLVPMQNEGDLDFTKTKHHLEPEQMQELARNIASQFK